MYTMHICEDSDTTCYLLDNKKWNFKLNWSEVHLISSY